MRNTSMTQRLEQAMSRRAALGLIGKTSAVAFLASACGVNTPQVATDQARRPNIIYMHTHDSGDFMSRRGGYEPSGQYLEYLSPNRSLKNLWKFADQGVTFTNAFSAAPTCSPSRAALLTGMTPGCNGMWGLAHLGHELNDYNQGLVPFLNSAGYTTALVGVQHIAAGTPKDCAERIGYHQLLPSQGRAAEHIADAAVAFLDNTPKQPFFLDIGFAETHLLPNGESRFGYNKGDPAAAFIPRSIDITAETRQDMADFKVAFEQLDVAMGKVFDALDRTRLRDDTVVIVTTDHGMPLPGMKGNHDDKGLEVMLTIRGPLGFFSGHQEGKDVGGGRRIPALVSQIDIFPTLCELLELEPPYWLQGKSLMPLVRGEVEEINEAVYAEHEAHVVREPQASVRTKRYKYIRRLDGSTEVKPRNTDDTYTKELWSRDGWRFEADEQLYDLEMNPVVRNNVARLPAYADVLDKMRNLMVDRMEKYNNPLLHRYHVTAAPPAELEPAAAEELGSSGNENHQIGVIDLAS